MVRLMYTIIFIPIVQNRDYWINMLIKMPKKRQVIDTT